MENIYPKEGNDIRNGIYLPKGTWIDYFSGERYEGDRIINNFNAPIWKLPVFIKNGAIIPMANANNNVTEINKGLRIYQLYPAGNTSFTEYEDDGLTEAYKNGAGATTLIESSAENNKATITIYPSKGNFTGFIKNKVTEFHINVSQQPTGVIVLVGKKPVALKKATSKADFLSAANVYYFDPAPNLNEFATKGSPFEKVVITKNPQLLIKLAAIDITSNGITLTVNGFRLDAADRLLKSSGSLAAPKQAGLVDSNSQAYSLKPTWNKVPNADYYEIVFNGQMYSTISSTGLAFEDLVPETNYTFKLRSVNKTRRSDWISFSAKTKVNPLEFAIKNISGHETATAEEGSEISNLFDFDETSMWHTEYGQKAIPFELVMDLRSVNQLEKIQYLPRSRGNGILLKGAISYSMNNINWTDAGPFEWAKNGDTKEFLLRDHPTARYVKLKVTDAVGNYGSGRELYVFKVPGSVSIIPGDINNDKKIDNNDLTSYINYTGLRKGDGDFDGYISKGDINGNGLIDAYDISTVTTQMDGGVGTEQKVALAGKIEMSAAKQQYNKGEMIELKVTGIGLKAVNAISFALPYNAQDVEFVGLTPINTKAMQNMTNDRLHSNGVKALYPTFVNVGDQPVLSGTMDVFIIKLKAKRMLTLDLKLVDGLLVDKQLNTVKF
ncbi:MAG: DUF5110 domain-containing protein [Chitinophagaceae bacterium]